MRFIRPDPEGQARRKRASKGRERDARDPGSGPVHRKVHWKETNRPPALAEGGAGPARPLEGQHHWLGAGEHLPFSRKRPGEQSLVIPVSSDRGLWTSSFKCEVTGTLGNISLDCSWLRPIYLRLQDALRKSLPWGHLRPPTCTHASLLTGSGHNYCLLFSSKLRQLSAKKPRSIH